MNRIEEIKVAIKREIRKNATHLKGYRVVLFGSRAAGTAKERSDFDIGIIGENPLPAKDFFALEDSFDAIETLYRIELVDLQNVSPSFREEALKHTEVLYG